MMNGQNENNLDTTAQATGYLPRPRLDAIIDQAVQSKLVYVIAGSGYGKTRAIHHYIEQQPDAVIRWMQLTESDNIGFRYWESLTHIIASDNPELAARLRELGFPETPARFKQFGEIVKNRELPSQKTFLVLDDFHLIHSKEALDFAQRCAYLDVPGACVIIISRTEPEINAVSLFSEGKASRITEDELRFTEDEIASFLRRNDISFAAEDIPRFADATKGWPLAVKLLSLVLKRTPGHSDHALDVMKQNIFQLLQREAWDDFPASIQKEIVRLSLVSSLPLVSLHEVINEELVLKNADGLSSVVWFDSFAGDYQIHPLYQEFVQSKQDMLSDEEKQAIYQQAAQWCSENDFYMDAVYYYAKSHQFDRVIEVLFSYPFKLPQDACEYFLGILEGIDPSNEEQDDPSVLFLKHFFIPIMLIGAGKYDEAREQSFATIQEWEHSTLPFSSILLGVAYSNLAYVDIYVCTITHRYDAPKYLKKSIENFKKSPLPRVGRRGSFAVPDIRSYACVVGEGATLAEFDQFLKAVEETAHLIEENFHDMYYGYDDLIACEIAFFKNQIDEARASAYRAVLKAREKNQYSIEAMAQQYLLRIAVQEGAYSLAKELLEQLGDHLDNLDFWNRQLAYDLYTGFFYAQIELPEMVPTWLVIEKKELASEARLPTRELVVSVKYHIAAKEYDQALAILYKSTPRDPQERLLFGELILSLLMAVAKIKTGDSVGALADFNKAWRLSFDGVFEMFFIELGKNLHPLVVAALKQEDGDIPHKWLRMIDRKASIYAKKADIVAAAIKREKNIEDPVQLSEREQEVLNDLYYGLSREEIATNRYLSVNTVKKALQSIYIKLDANNMADAIRIALEKKLLK